jgi:hypothetical protein
MYNHALYQELIELGLGSSKGLLFSKKSLIDPSGLLTYKCTENLGKVFMFLPWLF